MLKSTERFSDKVENYILYRPGYPPEALETIVDYGKLAEHSILADIGSGTGIFSKALLDAGYTVHAVEPNDAMRNAAEKLLGHYPNFYSIKGTGEDTTILSGSIDMIVCATAFHWLDLEKAKKEFNRILRPGGKVALIWNIRVQDGDDFSIAYEMIMKHQQKEDKNNMTEAELACFFTGEYEVKYFHNEQEFDLKGLIGRSLSSSFSPMSDSGEGQVFMKSLNDLFGKYQVDGKIKVCYKTKVYLGEIEAVST